MAETDLQLRRIIFISQFPPPLNGLTFITSRVAEALKGKGHDVEIIATNGPIGAKSLTFHAVRFSRTLRAMLALAANGLSGRSRTVYLAADGGLGLLHAVMIAGCARAFGYELAVHHHSYSYIAQRRALMRALISAAGPQAVHICLSVGMAKALAARYGRLLRTHVISNAAFVAPGPARDLPNQTLTIGLLSNLSPEKGLNIFLDLLRAAKASGLSIRGVLAGPLGDEDDRKRIEEAQRALGADLDYRGALFGEAKTRFFDDIDVFVFPTSYVNEAQPTVLFEAMARAVSVIAFDRGSIREQVGRGGVIVDRDADFVARALATMADYRDHPDRLLAHRRAAHAQFEQERASGREAIGRLFSPLRAMTIHAARESTR